MKTVLTRSPQKAAQFILQRKLVAFPTETVYGLAATIHSEDAIERMFRVKGRPPDNPVIIHIGELAQLGSLVSRVPKIGEKLIEAFFPGPLTLVMRKRPEVSGLVSAGLDTIGVRMPRHPAAQALLAACCVPLAAPSANLSGKPSPTTWQAVYADLGGRISCILKGDQTEVGLESTVVDCTGRVPVVLRAGAVTLEQLRAVNPATRLAEAQYTLRAKSPGMKHRHYAPRAKVVLVNHPRQAVAARNSAYIGLKAPEQGVVFRHLKVCRDIEDYAHSLFHFFRECDATRVAVIHCQTVPASSLGLALMDRLERASHQ